MPDNKASKGNPASKRMMNEKLKAKRKRSWTRCQEKKAKRREEQQKREAKNRLLREQGLPTPWEETKKR